MAPPRSTASSVDVKQITLNGMEKSGMGRGTTLPPPPLLYACLAPQSRCSRCSSGDEGCAHAPAPPSPALRGASCWLLLLPTLPPQAGGRRVASAGGTSTPREASGAWSKTPRKAAR